MDDLKKFSERNLYEVLGIQEDATEQQIRKAYRKKALECHPDKNPDNPKAASLFRELSKVLEILTDTAAKSAYDKILSARKATEIRNKKLDSKRQKLKSDLERREREASNSGSNLQEFSNKSDEEKFKQEFERLRKEGSNLLEEEQNFMKQQLLKEKLQSQSGFNTDHCRIKIKWEPKENPTLNYTENTLRNYLKKYGDITALLVSTKKNGCALVEFKSIEAGEMAVNYEKGNLDNPLKLEWINKPLKTMVSSTSSLASNLDYESLVLRQMRQMEERKRLTEQLIKDETN